jgi:hypothetical protein
VPLWFGGGLPCGVGRSVVALLWWWGVVFDLWIVVASIEDLQRFVRCGCSCNANFSDARMCCVVLFVGVVWCVWVTHFLVLCCKCLRAHGGCLGTGSR